MTCTKHFLWAAAILAWGVTTGQAGAAPLSVFVTIAPQRYFVEQIGGELVTVQVLVEPGADPHTYEPRPQQMAALSKALLYFAIGVEMEAARLDKIVAMNPDLKVIHTDDGILKLPMDARHHHEEEHSHRKKGEDDHDHGTRDPHVWLSPPMVMMQARTILLALQAADPNHRTVYEANYRQFMVSLVDLDARLRETFDGLSGSAFMVFHPSWGTFAHTYGLKQVPIELEGKSPKPAQIGQLIEFAKENHIRVIFVQPQFSSKGARQIAKSISGRVIIVDPLAPDWATNLQKAAEEFKHAFR